MSFHPKLGSILQILQAAKARLCCHRPRFARSLTTKIRTKDDQDTQVKPFTWRYPPELPVEVQERLAEQILQGWQASTIAKYYDSLRDQMYTPDALYGPKEALAYAAFELLPSYGVIERIRLDAEEILGDSFNPKSVLDFGSGPGTATISMSNFKSLEQAVLIEPSRSMLQIAERLLSFKTKKMSTNHCASLPDFLETSTLEEDSKFDIVSCAYVFSELPTIRARSVALKILWEFVAPNGIILFVEKGDKVGINIAAQARETLISLIHDSHGLLPAEDRKDQMHGRAIAPCTHILPCPLFLGNYPEGRFRSGCHFQQRTLRSVTLRSSSGKGLGKDTQNQLFSYFVFQKVARSTAEQTNGLARILRPPLYGKKHVTLDLCLDSGELERRVLSKGSENTELYKYARKAAWGDLWPS